jgi:hypothetical protein
MAIDPTEITRGLISQRLATEVVAAAGISRT